MDRKYLILVGCLGWGRLVMITKEMCSFESLKILNRELVVIKVYWPMTEEEIKHFHVM